MFAPDGFALPKGQPPARGADSIRKACSHGGGMPTTPRAIDSWASGLLVYVVGAYELFQAREPCGPKFALP